MRSENLKFGLSAILVGVVCGLGVHGCSESKKRILVPAESTTSTKVIPPPQFVQVERLGRPVVNEGLVKTNAFLLTLNSITPAEDIPTLTDPANVAVFNEIVGVLNALDGLVGGDEVNNNDVVQAFMPDVMRVDTTLTIPVGTGAYAFGALTVGTVVRPIGGRKIEDDSFDITATVLAGGALGDNVDYNDGTADGVGQPDHGLLNGQSSPNGSATFPFLAAAQ